MTSPFRQPRPEVSTWLVYAFPDAQSRQRTRAEVAFLVSGPIVLGGALAFVAGPLIGALALVGSTAMSAVAWRRRPTGVVLRVSGGTLHLKRLHRDAKESTWGPLADLADVTLESKVEPDGPNVGHETSSGPRRLARIVLVAIDAGTHPIAAEYRPHLEATEWLGRVRSFLRQSDWIPLDERTDDPSVE
jgi:hypothetical protein